MRSATFDVIVLGAGPAGENVADRVARGGLTAALVESELVGGECSYWACMPSKALLRDAEALAAVRALPGARAALGDGKLDVAAVLARRDSFASHWSDEGQVGWATGKGIEVVRGHGRLAGPLRVLVEHDGEQSELVARVAVVLATGSGAAVPPVPGLAESRPWTSREATSSSSVPRRLVVLGGGVVGCEMATAWRALGSEVVLLQRGPRLLPEMEPFAGERVEAALRGLGVVVRLGVTVTAAARPGDGPTTLTLDGGEELEGDVVLVATGRFPRTADIGLDSVGLSPGAYVGVDDTLRAAGVGDGWLYAVGDVNGRRLLTHMAKYQARLCGDVIVARARGEHPGAQPWSPFTATADARATPAVVFTEPQVASVGLTLDSALAQGITARAVDYDIGDVAGASLFADGYSGQARMVVDEQRRVVVGATFVGPAVSDLLHAATVAIVGEVPLDRLWHAVPSYPTISEIWLRLLETYGL